MTQKYALLMLKKKSLNMLFKKGQLLLYYYQYYYNLYYLSDWVLLRIVFSNAKKLHLNINNNTLYFHH